MAQFLEIKGNIEAWSEKNGGIKIDGSWLNTSKNFNFKKLKKGPAIIKIVNKDNGQRAVYDVVYEKEVEVKVSLVDVVARGLALLVDKENPDKYLVYIITGKMPKENPVEEFKEIKLP